MTDKIVVLVTCGSLAEAKKIARAVVEARLAACANVLGGLVESTYRWKGKVETAKEVLLLIKSTQKICGAGAGDSQAAQLRHAGDYRGGDCGGMEGVSSMDR